MDVYEAVSGRRVEWADAGMYLQTVMLLLRAEGLYSYPQVMWTTYRGTVSDVVGAGERLVLLRGVAVGFDREGAPRLHTGRADMAETVSFVGGPQPAGSAGGSCAAEERSLNGG